MRMRVGIAGLAGILGFACAASSASAINVVRVATPADTSVCSRTATFRSIQSAINSARNGTQIYMCPGTYQEQITIPFGDQNVVLSAVTSGVTITPAPGPAAQNAVVDIQGSGTVIKGITIDGGGRTKSPVLRSDVLYGVVIASGSGTASADIENSHITDVLGNPASIIYFGRGSFTGVDVQVGTHSNLLPTPGQAILKKNVVDGFGGTGVAVEGAGSTVNMVDNTVDGSSGDGATAVLFSPDSNGVVNGNTINGGNPDGNSGPAISIAPSNDGFGPQPGHGINIENNSLIGGVAIEDGGQYTQIFNNTITGLQTFLGGILLSGVGTRVQSNRVNGSSGSGIELDNTSGALIQSNTVSGATFDGIRVNAPSSGTTLSLNKVSGSGGFDCVDTTGTGPLAPNRWINNTGKTSSPAGLCTPPSGASQF